MATAATAHLLTLLDDYHSFNPRSCSLHPYPTPLQFSKQVGKGLPCVFSLTSHPLGPTSSQPLTPGASRPPKWPAQQWTKEVLVQKVTETVEVAITPDGRADSLCSTAVEGEKVFLQPATVLMSMDELLTRLCPPSPSIHNSTAPVYYLQSQNGNLTTTSLAPLLADLPKNLPFAKDVLGEPEAINIWIGNEQSVTSVHRDPYENLYLVLRGSKTFTLWAPLEEITLGGNFTSLPDLPIEICHDPDSSVAEMVRTGHYIYNDTTNPPSFSITLDQPSEPEADAEKIPWVPIDPDLPRELLDASHPLYRHAKPQIVTVSENQILYLPAGWYHHVSQECGTWLDGTVSPCIAVNYWYDQDYEGEKYVMRQHISRLVETAREEQDMTG